MKYNLWKLSTLVLAGSLAFVAGRSAVDTAEAAPQPHMKDALKALVKADRSLEAATADKGGHRVAALKLVKEAIEEVKKGIEFDNANKNSPNENERPKKSPTGAPIKP
ncbi:MAG: hypothetical protein FJ096_14355 [Deltaproteobacteria bacterium]|nr:hypothetical protein [Deltaproteobacteria bacterium]